MILRRIFRRLRQRRQVVALACPHCTAIVNGWAIGVNVETHVAWHGGGQVPL